MCTEEGVRGGRVKAMQAESFAQLSKLHLGIYDILYEYFYGDLMDRYMYINHFEKSAFHCG